MTFDPEAVRPMHLLEWVGISAAAYTASYLALGKNPWKYYLRKIAERKAKKSCANTLEEF